ncbi:MAG: MBL fold metallo-hydrolase [Lachnospiraceae bacterium]|nr:MBL fold metallo-hydrolase [Lachnospiraceae bacterium]
MYERKKFNHLWDSKMDPFRIAGNVYFVGTFQASSHLIDTGDGLILIDTGYLDSFFLVIHSIHALGFDPKDVKYIINTHWHYDHTEATAAMTALCGAKTLIGRDDYDKALRYFTPDICVKDGDTLSLGNTTITFMETPGHTKGTISLFFNTEENGKTYRVGMFGGAGANTLAKDSFDYEGCREGYLNSLNRLRGEKVDIFIGNHVWNNDTYEKGKLLLETGENRFFDAGIWGTFLDFCEERLNKVIAAEQEETQNV